MPPTSSPLAVTRTFSRLVRPASHPPKLRTILHSIHGYRLPPPKSIRISPFLSSPFSTSPHARSTEIPSKPIPTPSASPRPLTDRVSPSKNTHIPPPPSTRPPQPSYALTFTCTPCSTRSTHNVSKQGYHHGSVLVTCPSCKNRHVISDHLNIFGDKSMTIEDLMREKGELVRKGTLSEGGDLEFWEDGSVSPHLGAVDAKLEGLADSTNDMEGHKKLNE